MKLSEEGDQTWKTDESDPREGGENPRDEKSEDRVE